MKALRIFLFILIIIGVLMLLTQKFWVPKLVSQIISRENAKKEKQIPTKQTGEALVSISISNQDVKEENFSGKISVVSGSSKLAVEAQKYIEESLTGFRKQANADVPEIRKEFGADNPASMYEIIVDAKYIRSEKTESIVILEYAYTGGAHGNSLYIVITARIPDGKILSLSDVIKQDKQTAFIAFVQKELSNWRPDGGEASVIFPDSVKDLKFDSFANWSMNDKNLIIYFAQYEIGPGSLGPVAFPLSIEQIKNFLR